MSELAELEERTIVLGVCGGIAAYKVADLASRLVKLGAMVQVVMTRSAEAFVRPLTFEALTNHRVHCGMFEAEGEGLLHLNLAASTDLVIVAPATANTIAKYANGIADNLLTSVLLATAAPVLMVPAMEPNMWEHPATQANVLTLKEREVNILGPAEGHLASGKSGVGRMVEPSEIITHVLELLANPPLLA